MPVSTGERFVIPKEVLIQDLDGEMVLLQLKKGEYFGLDATGSRFWRALVEGKTTAEAAKQLLEEYQVGPERLEQDLSILVQKLTENGLLEIDASPA